MTPPIRTPADAVAFLRQLAGSPDESITHAALANAANALEAAIAATPLVRPLAKAEDTPPASPLSIIDIVFDGPPGPVSGRFVEVENASGQGINVGEWIERKDGYWALRLYAPASPWRDMESAPRDGTRIDLWYPRTRRLADCWWDETFSEFPGGCWAHETDEDGPATRTVPPTHWMPLPPPPTQATTQEA